MGERWLDELLTFALFNTAATIVSTYSGAPILSHGVACPVPASAARSSSWSTSCAPWGCRPNLWRATYPSISPENNNTPLLYVRVERRALDSR